MVYQKITSNNAQDFKFIRSFCDCPVCMREVLKFCFLVMVLYFSERFKYISQGFRRFHIAPSQSSQYIRFLFFVSVLILQLGVYVLNLEKFSRFYNFS